MDAELEDCKGREAEARRQRDDARKHMAFVLATLDKEAGAHPEAFACEALVAVREHLRLFLRHEGVLRGPAHD